VSGDRPRRLVRILAWLLTPLVAWAASFLGGWLAATLARNVASPGRAVIWLGGGAVLGAALGAGAWIWFLLRLGRGREAATDTERGG
jgi:hypothetical protein